MLICKYIFIFKTISILILLILLSAVICSCNDDVHQFTDPNYSFNGYILDNSSISHHFSNGTGPFKISRGNSNASFSLSSDGLKIAPKAPNGIICVVPTNLTRASTAAIHIKDLQYLDSNHTACIFVQFGEYPPDSRVYDLYIYLYGDQEIILVPGSWTYPGANRPIWISKLKNINFDYTLNELDILVQVANDVIHCEINGIAYTMPVNYPDRCSNDLYLKNMTFGSFETWSSPMPFNVTGIAVSNSSAHHYYDRLHRTITPWGYDFTYSIQLHADNIHPDQLSRLSELTRKYGIKGEVAAWMDTEFPELQYSIKTNQSYKNRLLELQQLGWDIGLHSVTTYDTNRSTLISLISEFDKEFGNLDSWVDHDSVKQDIWKSGSNPRSEYYISDYLSKNDIMIWVYQEQHSHSKGFDLNKDQVFYKNPAYPGLNLLRTSKQGVIDFFSGWDNYKSPVTAKDMDNKLRAFAAEGSVILLHDYTQRGYFYIEKDGTKYAIANYSKMGYPYTPIGEQTAGANIYSGGSWHIMEPLIVLYDALSKYNIWHATPREIWDRSRYIQNVSIHESACNVTIENPASLAIQGLTLTSINKPEYALKNDDVYIYPIKGAQNWHFVINDIPKESVYVLQKVPIPSALSQG